MSAEVSHPQVLPKVMPNFSFLQASSMVVALLLAQLHFQTSNLGFSSGARAICDVTWFWLVAATCFGATDTNKQRARWIRASCYSSACS